MSESDNQTTSKNVKVVWSTPISSFESLRRKEKEAFIDTILTNYGTGIFKATVYGALTYYFLGPYYGIFLSGMFIGKSHKKNRILYNKRFTS